MSALTITSNRNDDNSTTLTVTLPARRNGQVNFGCLEKINHVLLLINPDAFDPVEQPHTLTAPMPPAILEVLPSDEPEGLKAGEAYRNGYTAVTGREVGA